MHQARRCRKAWHHTHLFYYLLTHTHTVMTAHSVLPELPCSQALHTPHRHLRTLIHKNTLAHIKTHPFWHTHTHRHDSPLRPSLSSLLSRIAHTAQLRLRLIDFVDSLPQLSAQAEAAVTMGSASAFFAQSSAAFNQSSASASDQCAPPPPVRESKGVQDGSGMDPVLVGFVG